MRPLRPDLGPRTASSTAAEVNEPSANWATPGCSGWPSHTPCSASLSPWWRSTRWTTVRAAVAGPSSHVARSSRLMSSKGRMGAGLPCWRPRNPASQLSDGPDAARGRSGRRVSRPGCANRTNEPSNRPGPAPDGARTMPSASGFGCREAGRSSRRCSRVIAWWYQVELGAAADQVEAGPHQLVRDRRPARVGDDPELDAPGVDLLGDLVAQLALLQVPVERRVRPADQAFGAVRAVDQLVVRGDDPHPEQEPQEEEPALQQHVPADEAAGVRVGGAQDPRVAELVAVDQRARGLGEAALLGFARRLVAELDRDPVAVPTAW